jgi:hypothetical protein
MIFGQQLFLVALKLVLWICLSKVIKYIDNFPQTPMQQLKSAGENKPI